MWQQQRGKNACEANFGKEIDRKLFEEGNIVEALKDEELVKRVCEMEHTISKSEKVH